MNSRNYIIDFYEDQVSGLSVHDLRLLEDIGLKDEEISTQLKLPKSFINQLMYEHRKDY